MSRKTQEPGPKPSHPLPASGGSYTLEAGALTPETASAAPAKPTPKPASKEV
jgi:hypothetical protein